MLLGMVDLREAHHSPQKKETRNPTTLDPVGGSEVSFIFGLDPSLLCLVFPKTDGLGFEIQSSAVMKYGPVRTPQQIPLSCHSKPQEKGISSKGEPPRWGNHYGNCLGPRILKNNKQENQPVKGSNPDLQRGMLPKQTKQAEAHLDRTDPTPAKSPTCFTGCREK